MHRIPIGSVECLFRTSLEWGRPGELEEPHEDHAGPDQRHAEQATCTDRLRLESDPAEVVHDDRSEPAARRRRQKRTGGRARPLFDPFSRRYARSPASHRGGSMLSFGVTVLPDPPYQRMIELMKLAEQHGFEYAWTYDSHILWEESYATLHLVAAQTSKIKLGHFVTNPGIRDPTITASWYATMQDISDGRMVMGI